MIAYALIVAINIDAESVSSAAPAVEVAPVATALPRGEPVVFIVPVAPTVAPAPVEVIKPAAAPAAAVEVAPQAPKPDEPWFEWPKMPDMPPWAPWFFGPVLVSVVIALIPLWGFDSWRIASLLVFIGAAIGGVLGIGVFCIGLVSDAWNGMQSTGGADMMQYRLAISAVAVLIQLSTLTVKLAAASHEKRTPLGLLGGIFLWILGAGVVLAVAPVEWAFPLIYWAGWVILTTFVKIAGVVVMTTNFFKPKSDGNAVRTVHDDAAITGNIGAYEWGHIGVLLMASLWTISMLLGL